jgi:DNA-binding response OmpR family regulator
VYLRVLSSLQAVRVPVRYIKGYINIEREGLRAVEGFVEEKARDRESGFTVCQILKQQPATTHLLVLQLSAVYVQEADKVQGLESGADAYLTGPVEPSVLLATLRALLRTRHAEAALREVNATLEQRVAERTAALRHEITARMATEAQVAQAHAQLQALLAQTWPKHPRSIYRTL